MPEDAADDTDQTNQSPGDHGAYGAYGPPTTAADPSGGDTPAKEMKWRRRLVVAMVVLTAIATFVSTIGFWSHNVLLNTDKWVETVGPLAHDPVGAAGLAGEWTRHLDRAPLVESARLVAHELDSLLASRLTAAG